QHTNRALVLEERVRDLLVDAGLQEVVTYSLTESAKEAPLGLPGPGIEYVKLKNPISSERTALRQHVLAGVLDVVAANLRHAMDVRVFEVGPVYLRLPGQKLPTEPRRLAIVLTGRRWPEHWSDGPKAQNSPVDFFDMKGVIEALVSDLHLSQVSYPPPARPYLHPGRAAELNVG